MAGGPQQAKAERRLSELAHQDDCIARPCPAPSAWPVRFSEGGDRHRPCVRAGNVPADERASVPPRQGRHPSRDAARDAQRVRSRGHSKRAEEPARPGAGCGEIGERRRQRLVPHVVRGEPAPVEVHALDQLVHLQDQLPSGGRAHHGAVVARTGQHTGAGCTSVARQSERSEEGVDEPELVHCAPRSEDSSGAPGGSMGTTRVKMLPLPGSLRTEMPPPCAST